MFKVRRALSEEVDIELIEVMSTAGPHHGCVWALAAVLRGVPTAITVRFDSRGARQIGCRTSGQEGGKKLMFRSARLGQRFLQASPARAVLRSESTAANAAKAAPVVNVALPTDTCFIDGKEVPRYLQ